MTPIGAAPCYAPCSDLWVITTYFNPAGYTTLRRNYETFAAPMHQAGIRLITVECAFEDQTFTLPAGPDTIQVKSCDVLWFKERLINLAISKLPPEAQKIMWVDADLLFCNPNWALETSLQLDHSVLVQPCSSVHRLGRNQHAYEGHGYLRHSFIHEWKIRPESAHLHSCAHGFPGFAWAARRSLIEKHGLYDAHILGSNDELFAHAATGGLNSWCVRNITNAHIPRRPKLVNKGINRLQRAQWPAVLGRIYQKHSGRADPTASEPFFSHFLDWARPFASDVNGRMDTVAGMALHLWHGDTANRLYNEREFILKKYGFNPDTDLRLGVDGLWQWAADKPELHQAVKTYFQLRRDDS